MHLLLFLHPHDRFMDADRVDQIISAELPDPALDTDVSLRQIIVKQMVHGPCGAPMPTASCMQSESGSPTCSKRYPRPFQETTVVEEDGYPIYRRRSDGRTWEVPMSGGRVFRCDNRWVVPYNPYLSRKYEAHINVEVSATVDDDDNDYSYSDVVPAEGRPMRASLYSFIVHGKPFEEEKPCNPEYGRGPSGSQPCAP